MEHNYDIEEFKGGGRISPENSATDFPKGTLGVGKNGKVWINLPDKNGRLSWKPTENDFPISYIFSFGYWDDETFDFQIKLDGKELFKLRYAYEYENSYLAFTYPNGDTQQEAGNLDELLDFFNDNFVVNTFDLLNTNPNINGTKITTEVKILISRLKFLINNKGLRSPETPKTPETPEPKFKVGDLVIRKGGTQVMTVVKQIYDDNQKTFDYDLKFVKEGTNNSLFENELELYNRTPFEQIDFLKPSTEELDILIKGMQNYSDGLTFLSNRVANVKIKTKTGADFEIVAIFDLNGRSAIQLLETTTKKDIVSNKITNESLIEISEIYVSLLGQLMERVEGKTPSKDCEADPNKIISGQVKKFYDLNKTRIEKLDSKFSCKIVQALVSLSEYESCGSPSSVTLPKAKSDLLSRISKLKI